LEIDRDTPVKKNTGVHGRRLKTRAVLGRVGKAEDKLLSRSYGLVAAEERGVMTGGAKFVTPQGKGEEG